MAIVARLTSFVDFLAVPHVPSNSFRILPSPRSQSFAAISTNLAPEAVNDDPSTRNALESAAPPYASPAVASGPAPVAVATAAPPRPHRLSPSDLLRFVLSRAALSLTISWSVRREPHALLYILEARKIEIGIVYPLE